MPVSQTFLDPLSYLRDSMLALKDRVREAVSAELSRIVGQTVQDVMQRALQRTEPPREPPLHDPWDDEVSDDEDDEVDNRRAIQPSPPSCLRNGWLVAAGQLLFWCLTRPIRPWWPVLLLTGAGVAAYSQQPIVWAVFTAVKTASELLTP